MTSLAEVESNPVVKLPNMFRVIFAVARVTFLEILQDRVLYNVLLLSGALILTGILASQMTFIGADRVLLDFGLSGINLSCAILGLALGASTLNREFQRRTVYVALSRPITRGQFVIGKYLGVVGILFLNWALLVVIYLAALLAAASMPMEVLLDHLHASLTAALVLLFFQGCLVAAIALAFSTLSSTAVSAMLAIGCYLLGNTVSALRVVAVHSSMVTRFLLETASNFIPDLEYFNIGQKVTYALPVSIDFVVTSIGYGLLWIVIAIGCATLFVRTKET